MAKFNGNDLVLAINSTEGSELAFAHSQSASISFSNALIDVTSKDSNSWEEMISGRKSFSISTDGLADFVNSETTATTSESFSDYALAGTPIFFTFTKTGAASGDFEGYSGSGFIESFEITGPSDDVATYSCSITGTGVLTKVTTT